MKLLWSVEDIRKLLDFSTWTFYNYIRPLFPPSITQRDKGPRPKGYWTTDQVIAIMHHYYRIDDRAHAEIVRRVEEWTRPTKLTIIEDKAKKSKR